MALLVYAFFVSLVAAFVRASNIQFNHEGDLDDPGLAHYVSRPDLRAPKWNLTMHNAALNSRGYWFVSPFRNLEGDQANESFVGPCIFDGANGELIWSGGLMFDTNVDDFRLSNVNGEMRMTLMANNEAVILNDDYTVRLAHAPVPKGHLNTHDLNFIENGTRVLINKYGRQKASKEESKVVGFDGECDTRFGGFAELDVTKEDWPAVIDWNSYGRIGIDESTNTADPIEDLCTDGWDNIHGNAIDKTPEGDYIFSARHADTIYKVSSKDSSIIWRLGGVKSDFHIPDDAVFSRQHNVRYRGQNATHIFLSILDNSKGQDRKEPTHDFSRGLLLAVDETNMQVALEAHYDHPWHDRHGYAPRRGNYQALPNGHVMMGWSERAIQSEYTATGELIWEAVLQVDWLGAYRNYKFDGFVGKPVEPPTAVSNAHESDEGAETVVHVSWNGATEVDSWELYRTSPDGEAVRVLIATAAKRGFETALRYDGFAKHVVVDAINRHGRRIGNTSVVDTVAAPDVSADAIADAEQWLRDFDGASTWTSGSLGGLIAAFCAGATVGVVVLLAVLHARQPGSSVLRTLLRREQRYTPLQQEYADDGVTPLRSLSKESRGQDIGD